MKIPLSGPDITKKDIAAVVAVLKTSRLSLGPKLPEFEERFARYIGRRYAIAVNSGTSGLHLCIRALGIKAGDEVITTPFSFIASANCILFERARPVFADIRPDTYNIDESVIENKITKKTKAILPVHVFGYPCDMPKIVKIAKKHGLKVIEDSCESIGATISGKNVGTFSDCSVFAFYPNKQMTTGEGGMVVTDSKDTAELVRSMRNQGRDEGVAWLEHNRLGYNYRLSDIHCALGITQLARVREMLAKRSRVAKLYGRVLSGIGGTILPLQSSSGAERSWFVYVVRLDTTFTGSERDEILKRLKAKGIGCNNYFPPIHLQPFYVKEFGYRPGDFPVTESVSKRTIALPFFNNLSGNEVKCVAMNLKKIITEVKRHG